VNRRHRHRELRKVDQWQWQWLTWSSTWLSARFIIASHSLTLTLLSSLTSHDNVLACLWQATTIRNTLSVLASPDIISHTISSSPSPSSPSSSPDEIKQMIWRDRSTPVFIKDPTWMKFVCVYHYISFVELGLQHKLRAVGPKHLQNKTASSITDRTLALHCCKANAQINGKIKNLTPVKS